MAAIAGDELLLANARLRELLGRSPEEMTQGSWLQWFASAERERVSDAHVLRMAGQDLRERHEATLVHSSGRLVDVEATFRLVADATRRVTLLVVRDITARKLEEAARLETEARFRVVFDHAAVGIALTDLTGRHLDCNPALLDMLGLTLEEFRAVRSDEFTHPDDLSPDMTLWHQLEKGEIDSYQRETRYVRKDGAVIWVRLTVSFIRGAAGKPHALVSMVEDVTERKKAEEARERLLVELQEALDEVKVLGGLLPICAYCKQIRDDDGYWHQVESYIRDQTGAEFSHGICPNCLAEAVKELDD